MAYVYDSAARKPWNNVIFPGNYVAHLNAYRDQGVTSIPGYNFFRQVGALVIAPSQNGQTVLDSAGELPADTYSLQILSPDLRPDDKPRLDRPMIVPAGATVYRTAVTAVNLKGAGAETITVAGVTPAAVVTAAGGEFPVSGDYSAGISLFDGGSALGADTAVEATTSGALTPTPYCGGGSGSSKADPTAGQSAILVEVCFWMPAEAPEADDVHLPFPVEAGQTVN